MDPRLIKQSISSVAKRAKERITSNLQWAGQQYNQNLVRPSLNAIGRGIQAASSLPAPRLARSIANETKIGQATQQILNTPRVLSKQGAQAYGNIINETPVLGDTKRFIENTAKFATSQKPILSRQGLTDYAQAVGSGAKAGLSLTGATKLSPKLLGINAGFGAGIAALMKQNPIQGAEAGIRAAPVISGIGSFTNPAISRVASNLAGKAATPFQQAIINRLATGAANIPEGAVMSAAQGQPYSLGAAALDFGVGAVTGSTKTQANGIDVVKDASKFRVVHPEDRQRMVEFIDYVRLKKFKNNLDRQLEIDAWEIANHYGMNLPKTLNGIADEFDSVLTMIQYRNPNVKFAINLDQTPAPPEAKTKDLPGYSEERFTTQNSKPYLIDDQTADSKVLEANRQQRYKAQEASVDAIDRLINTPDDQLTGSMYPKGYWEQARKDRRVFKTQQKAMTSIARNAEAALEGKPQQNIGNFSQLSDILKSKTTYQPSAAQAQQVNDVADDFIKQLEADGLKPKTPKTKEDLKTAFAGWVNALQSSFLQAKIVKDKLSQFDSEGVGAFKAIQSGKSGEKYAAVRQILDAAFEAEKKAGVPVRYETDYLPQMWENDIEEIRKVFPQRITGKPGFTIEKVIDDYDTGIKLGLTPRFNTISELVAARVQQSVKAVSDKKFLTYLADNNLLLPEGKAPRDWMIVPPDRLRGLRYTDPVTQETFTKNFYAPKNVAELINNHFDVGRNPFVKNVADIASRVKGTLLNFGVPYTPINAHGFNILARSVLSGKGLRAIKYFANQGAAAGDIAKFEPDAPTAIRAGLTMSSPGTQLANDIFDVPNDAKTKFGAAWKRAFEEPLFQRVIPALKITHWKDVADEYSKSMPRAQAEREAAKFVNDLYGGINWRELGQDPTMQDLKRAIILAPDWLQTNLNIGKNIIKGMSLNIRDPRYAGYRKVAGGLAASYVGFNIINKITSGHWMWQNDPGNEMNIHIGYTEDGKARYIRPYGTAADFVRVPVDVASSIAKGDASVMGKTIRNRMSAILGPAFALLFNTDRFGRPIYGKDQYGNPIDAKKQIGGVANELATMVGVPSFIQRGVDVATGKSSLEEGALQAFEMPVRYAGGSYSALQKQAKEATGLKGKELYDLNKMTKGQDKLGSNQMSYLTQAQDKVGYIQEVFAKRDQDQKIKQMKEQTKMTGQPQSMGGIYTIKAENGDIKTIDLTKDLTRPALTGEVELDKIAVSNYRSSLTRRAGDIQELVEAGQMGVDEAIGIITTLKDEAAQLPAFKTPKTIKIRSVSAPKARKIKLQRAKRYKTRRSLLKVKKLKPVTWKRVRMRS